MVLDLTKYDLDDSATRLKNFLDEILEAVVSIYESANFPLPERRYWTLSPSAPADCEQATITLVNLYLGTPGDQAATPQRCDGPMSMVFSVNITRPVPVVSQGGRPPTPESIMAAQAVVAVDSSILWDNIEQFDLWGRGTMGLGIIATMGSSPSQGGYHTTTLQVTSAVP